MGALPPGVSQHMLPGCDPRQAEAEEPKQCDHCGRVPYFGRLEARGELRFCLTCTEEWDTDPEEVEVVEC
jgi:hypothetical protein